MSYFPSPLSPSLFLYKQPVLVLEPKTRTFVISGEKATGIHKNKSVFYYVL